ncbi:MAG: hypothetical protein QOF09_460 [Alphaproteobacteria bacterium]|nr:hypothetical protein [Alphaproteobacteria bacterium]
MPQNSSTQESKGDPKSQNSDRASFAINAARIIQRIRSGRNAHPG